MRREIPVTVWDNLLELAKSTSKNAYCPYSKFYVGAAVLTSDGSVFTGCNVENASYSLTICAERNAIFQAIAAGKRDIVALAIYTPTEKPTTPCGACRQVLIEFGREVEICCFCAAGTSVKSLSSELLPFVFSFLS
ncbi:MAG TPA: cytidine deaminase [Allocoleopsis sp.]